MVDWAKVKFFKPNEFGPSYARIDESLVYGVDALRGQLGSSIVIHTDGILAGRIETPDSMHPRGLALDCHAPGVALGDFFLLAERFKVFGGIGLYPVPWSDAQPQAWRNPGLHLDVRPGMVRARWWRDGLGEYRALDAKALAAILSDYPNMTGA